MDPDASRALIRSPGRSQVRAVAARRSCWRTNTRGAAQPAQAQRRVYRRRWSPNNEAPAVNSASPTQLLVGSRYMIATDDSTYAAVCLRPSRPRVSDVPRDGRAGHECTLFVAVGAVGQHPTVGRDAPQRRARPAGALLADEPAVRLRVGHDSASDSPAEACVGGNGGAGDLALAVVAIGDCSSSTKAHANLIGSSRVLDQGSSTLIRLLASPALRATSRP